MGFIRNIGKRVVSSEAVILSKEKVTIYNAPATPTATAQGLEEGSIQIKDIASQKVKAVLSFFANATTKIFSVPFSLLLKRDDTNGASATFEAGDSKTTTLVAPNTMTANATIELPSSPPAL
jgi:hypothetical protein